MTKTGMGTCPKCGSNNIEYTDIEYDFDTVIHTCECNDCHLIFQEYEKTIYDGYSYDGEDNKWYNFDADGNEIGK